MKKIYEIPQIELYRISQIDVLTASGFDDTANDMWPGGVDPQIFQ